MVNPTTMREAIEDLRERREASLNPGRPGSVEKHHAKGKLTARERIELLVDPGTFVETGRLRRAPSTGVDGESRPLTDGVVTGRAMVDGRPICLYSQDATVFGGSVGQVYAQKIVAIMELAQKTGCPIVGLADSAGARIQDGVAALASYQLVGILNVRLSGVVPQITVIMGTCAGGAVYSPAMGDFTFMVNGTSHMFVTGPEVVREVTGEEMTMEELGGADINAITGNAHHVDETDAEALESVRQLLSYLPSNNVAEPPRHAPTVRPDHEFTDLEYELDHLVPAEANKSYDVRDVVERVVDDGDFFEIDCGGPQGVVIGYARIDGRSVGVIANQPQVNAGVLTYETAEKAARFLRTCDVFNIPIITFVDVPGFMPGVAQERAGSIRRGAKLFYSYVEAKVPTVTVTLRKAYGGAYATMGSKHSLNDVNLAWPTAEIAVMGAPAEIKVLHGRELMQIMSEGGDVEAAYNALVDRYQASHNTPYPAAERGWVDQVIKPHETRREIARALSLMEGRRPDPPLRPHGNIPL